MKKILAIIIAVTVLTGCAQKHMVDNNNENAIKQYIIDDKFNINDEDKKYILPKENAHQFEAIEKIHEINCSYYMTTLKNVSGYNLEVQKSPFKSRKLFDDSYTECVIRDDFIAPDKYVVKISEVLSIDGVKATIRHYDNDGTFIVGRGIGYGDKKTWDGSCSKNPVTDAVSCGVGSGSFRMIKDKSGYSAIFLGNTFPSTSSYLRVGDNKPHIARQTNGVNYFDNGKIKKIISEINSSDIGVTIITQYTRWPDRNLINEKIDASYFNVAKKILDKVYENYM